MNFTNQVISPNDLPSIVNIAFHPLEKDYLLVERISFFMTKGILLLIAAPLFYFFDIMREPAFIIIAATLFISLSILGYISTSISFKYSGYALREKDLLFRNGWLIRRVRIVVRNRIQHVSVQSGPMERQFGLSSVSIFTAGSSEADFTIRGISEQTAQRIKEWINAETNGDTYQ